MTSRLIRGHELAERCQPWQAPEVSGPTLSNRRAADADDTRTTREKAWRDGFEEGRAAGLASAREDTARSARTLERALDALARPFEELDQRFHVEVLELVKAVARQVLRREMRIDPTHLVGVVREGLAALPMSASDIVVRMHPDDAAAVRQCLTPDDGERSWHIETDPLMERGGCVVVTAQSQIDGRLETRLGRTIATMFEDERKESPQHDSESPGPEPGQ
jgi:flagellar assembly protein FliH